MILMFNNLLLLFIIIEETPMCEISNYITSDFLYDQCKKWYKLNRKARRQLVWLNLFKALFRVIFPQIQYHQLLINQEDMFEHFQLFFNTAVSCHQVKKAECIQQNPAIDFILCLQGILEFINTQGIKYQWKINQVVAFTQQILLKNQKISIKVIQNCTYLRIQRKLMQKFKNDILRQDRDIKQKFMSDYLFCNFTPVYYINNINIIQVKENHIVQTKNNFVYLLYSGVIKRKMKNDKLIEGTELTKGCIINCKALSTILQKNQYFFQEQSYETKLDSVVLSFQLEEMSRIIKLNTNLKKLIEIKLKTLSNERAQLAKKSIQIISKFNERLKIQNESTQIYYPVDFKSRNIKSATPGSRSFRKMKGISTGDYNYAEFITFDKYDKMIESKERVALTKHSYINYQKKRDRPVYTADYQKKLKMQNKMMKIQTGKIQKISQRDSKKQCNSQQLEEIKRNLFQVTHLFDEPLQQIQTQNKTLDKKSKTFNNLTVAQHTNPRLSNLKPQQYLKNQYFNQFNSKSKTRFSLKEIDLIKHESNKENPFLQKSNSATSKKFKNFKLIINNVE